MFNKRILLQCLCSLALIGGLTLPCAAQPKKTPPPPPNPGTGNPNPGTGNPNPGTGNPGIGLPNPGTTQPGTNPQPKTPKGTGQPSAAAIQQARINDGFQRILTQQAMQNMYSSIESGQSNMMMNQMNPWMSMNPMMNQMNPWMSMNPMMNQMNPWMSMNPMMNQMNPWTSMNPMMNQMNPWMSMNPMMNQMNPWAMNPMMNNPMAFQMNPWQMNQPGLFAPGMTNPAVPGLFNNPGVFMKGGF
jgi:hypothetical protein